MNTTVNTGKEVIKGESRIEYVPFEKKIIEYKDEARVERVPKKRTVTEYREEKRIEEVPREVTITDYYAVEYLRQYIPQYIPEKEIQYVAKERKVKRYEYIPVERQIVHYPEQPLEAEVRANQGYVSGASGARQTGYAYTTESHYTQPTTTTTYNSGYNGGYATGGYATGGYATGGYANSGYASGVAGGSSGYGQETVTYTTTTNQPVTYVSSGSGARGQYSGSGANYQNGETVTYTTNYAVEQGRSDRRDDTY